MAIIAKIQPAGAWLSHISAGTTGNWVRCTEVNVPPAFWQFRSSHEPGPPSTATGFRPQPGTYRAQVIGPGYSLQLQNSEAQDQVAGTDIIFTVTNTQTLRLNCNTIQPVGKRIWVKITRI